MRFAATALCAAILAMGMPCPHVVHAMEIDVSSATMAHGAMDVHVTDQPSTHQGIATRDDDSCCIRVATTSAEADHIQAPAGDGIGVAASASIGPSPVIVSTVETQHPPDLQSPYHKRTTCQRE